jgi:hypothetical protein
MQVLKLGLIFLAFVQGAQMDGKQNTLQKTESSAHLFDSDDEQSSQPQQKEIKGQASKKKSGRSGLCGCGGDDDGFEAAKKSGNLDLTLIKGEFGECMDGFQADIERIGLEKNYVKICLAALVEKHYSANFQAKIKAGFTEKAAGTWFCLLKQQVPEARAQIVGEILGDLKESHSVKIYSKQRLLFALRDKHPLEHLCKSQDAVEVRIGAMAPADLKQDLTDKIVCVRDPSDKPVVVLSTDGSCDFSGRPRKVGGQKKNRNKKNPVVNEQSCFLTTGPGLSGKNPENILQLEVIPNEFTLKKRFDGEMRYTSNVIKFNEHSSGSSLKLAISKNGEYPIKPKVLMQAANTVFDAIGINSVQFNADGQWRYCNNRGFDMYTVLPYLNELPFAVQDGYIRRESTTKLGETLGQIASTYCHASFFLSEITVPDAVIRSMKGKCKDMGVKACWTMLEDENDCNGLVYLYDFMSNDLKRKQTDYHKIVLDVQLQSLVKADRKRTVTSGFGLQEYQCKPLSDRVRNMLRSLFAEDKGLKKADQRGRLTTDMWFNQLLQAKPLYAGMLQRHKAYIIEKFEELKANQFRSNQVNTQTLNAVDAAQFLDPKMFDMRFDDAQKDEIVEPFKLDTKSQHERAAQDIAQENYKAEQLEMKLKGATFIKSNRIPFYTLPKEENKEEEKNNDDVDVKQIIAKSKAEKF